MGNVLVTPTGADVLTIDISGITTEQRRLLKLTIGYTDTIPDPNNVGQFIANPVPLLAAVLMDSMAKRRQEMFNIAFAEEQVAAQEEARTAAMDKLEDF